MGKKVKTNSTEGSVAPVPHKRKVRLLLWGGAYATGDNSAFEWSARHVVKDYKAGDSNKYEIISKKVESADNFIEILNAQEDDSIRSLDLFTHGGPDNFYMVSVRANKDGWINSFRWYRYVFHNVSFSRSDLKKIQFAKFTENAKVEIHGCKTASDPKDEDNIVADFSKRLYEAGKTKSAVIGHTTEANPEINGRGKTKNPDQDYRFGQRAIYKNGSLVLLTNRQGALDEAELAK